MNILKYNQLYEKKDKKDHILNILTEKNICTQKKEHKDRQFFVSITTLQL